MQRYILALLAVALFATACGGSSSQEPVGNQPESGAELAPNLMADYQAIPADSLLPWESLGADGTVDPATARRSSAINENSEFWRGADFWQVAGTTAPAGQALTLSSGTAGSLERSSASFRIPLTGANPATISTDINLRPRDDGSLSDFYIGIANYSTGRWDWSGPYSDGRIRKGLSDAETGNYISPLGNAFITVMAFNGSEFDIVGISLNQFDLGDAVAPPDPTGLSLSPVAGGLELQWNGVLAGDLAGYRIYWRASPITNLSAIGVKRLNYIEGDTRHVLDGLDGPTWVAVTAVDLNGNESGFVLETATPLAGDAPVVSIKPDSNDGLVNSVIELNASGADSYDWDLDGNGVYEVTGDATGTQFADTGKAGIIRPAVRASSGGTAVALGAVSLIIASDLPPVAILSANRTSGVIQDGESSPLAVDFDGSNSYDDGSSLDYAWSLQGDGSWTPFGPADSLGGEYASSGIYNAAMRVQDSAGQEALALLPITVQQVTGFRENRIVTGSSGIFGALAIVDGRPAVVFRRFGGPMSNDGLFYSRALDSEGRAWGTPVPISIQPTSGEFCDMAVINGNPAIIFARFSDSSINYIRSADSTGQTLASWTNAPVKLEGPISISEEPHLTEVSGNPALIWMGSGEIWYKRATSLAGTGDNAGDWADAAIKIVSSGADVRPDLAMIDGKPAVAYRDGAMSKAMYLRSTSSTGASALDWPVSGVVVSGPDSCGGRVNLAEVNGAPAVSYFEGGMSSLRYVRANTADGVLLADWPLAVVIYDYNSPGQNFHDLAVINGRPAIAYEDHTYGSTTSYVRASNANGSAWPAAQHVAPQFDPMDSAYDRIDLEDLNGFPAIYLHSGSDDRAEVYTVELDL